MRTLLLLARRPPNRRFPRQPRFARQHFPQRPQIRQAQHCAKRLVNRSPSRIAVQPGERLKFPVTQRGIAQHHLPRPRLIGELALGDHARPPPIEQHVGPLPPPGQNGLGVCVQPEAGQQDRQLRVEGFFAVAVGGHFLSRSVGLLISSALYQASAVERREDGA